MNVEDELTGKKRSYPVTAAKGLLLGLICGAILGAIVMIVVEGPSSIFSVRSPWIGRKSGMLSAVIAIYIGTGTLLGSIVGIIAALVKNSKRH